jgi:head-tail adaptor
MGLPAGILRETVVIESPAESRNSLGETIQTWATFANRRASIVAESYSEAQQRGQVVGTGAYTVRMRYVEGLTGKMRIRWQSRGNRILYIAGLTEVNNREEHSLSCEEKAT